MKRRTGFGRISAVAAVSALLAACAVAQPAGPAQRAGCGMGPGYGMGYAMGPQDGAGGYPMGRGAGYRMGQYGGPNASLMSVEERNAHREKMRTLATVEERQAYMAEHREQMQQRAQERGVPLCDGPAAGRQRGQ